MSTVNQDELRAIKVVKFTGKESEWDQWSEKFVALARARGFAGTLLGTEKAPRADEEIDKKADGSYELTEAEREEKKRLRQANGNAYINLQLSCEELPYDLVSLAKTEELPDGCARDAWESLTSEYDLTEGEDKITLVTMFQQNILDDVRIIITVWLTSLVTQVNKLKKLNHVLDEEYQITHILASVPREYSSVVEQVKIDRRTDTYNPECTHNPMAIQCNQYPNPSHNLALPQFLAHHNCEDLDPTDTPSAIPTTIQAPKLCTHNPSTSQVKKSNHTNPVGERWDQVKK